MAGYSQAYWIGEPGGYLGADGMNPIHLELLVGDGNRQWWEPSREDLGELRLGSLTRFVPAAPNEPVALLDACLAFYTTPFRNLSAHRDVESELGATTFLDFDAEPEGVPVSWKRLRAEAVPIFHKLYIMRGEFRNLDVSGFTL